MVFLKEIFEKANFEKINRQQKYHETFPSMQKVNLLKVLKVVRMVVLKAGKLEIIILPDRQ